MTTTYPKTRIPLSVCREAWSLATAVTTEPRLPDFEGYSRNGVFRIMLACASMVVVPAVRIGSDGLYGT